MAYRESKSDNVIETTIGVIVMAAVSCDLVQAVGWLWALAGWAGLFGGLISWAELSNRRDKNRQAERLASPCAHGISGAAYSPALCPECERENAARRGEAERERKRLEAAEADERRELWRQLSSKLSEEEYLRSLHPAEFETIVCTLFEQMGCRVERTPYTGDHGSDGFIYFPDGHKAVLQCKRFKGSVGEPIIRDLYGTMHGTGCKEAVLVTIGAASRQALAWAAGKPIRIIQVRELRGIIRSNFRPDVVPKAFTPCGWGNVPQVCPACGSELRVRLAHWHARGERRKYLRCSAYPRCHYTHFAGTPPAASPSGK